MKIFTVVISTHLVAMQLKLDETRGETKSGTVQFPLCWMFLFMYMVICIVVFFSFFCQHLVCKGQKTANLNKRKMQVREGHMPTLIIGDTLKYSKYF